MNVKQKIFIYERFLHQLQMYMSVTLNDVKTRKGLKIIDDWSYAHRVGNGELSDRLRNKLIDSHLKRMKDYGDGL